MDQEPVAKLVEQIGNLETAMNAIILTLEGI
jgi:hypothetical protein